MAKRVAVGWRFALCVGVVVMVASVVASWVRPAPESIVGWLGGPTGVERWGGLRVRLQPTGEAAPKVIELPGVSAAAAADVLALVQHGLTFREVRADWDSAIPTLERTLPRGTLSEHSSPVKMDFDVWKPKGATRLTMRYTLIAPSWQQIEQLLDQARAEGWRLNEGVMFGYLEHAATETMPRLWESYEMKAKAALDGRIIDEAWMGEDLVTGESLIRLRFTDEGADRFCELTERVTGEKLATAIGSQVLSAPIISGKICNGRFAIPLLRDEPLERAVGLSVALNHAREFAGGGVILAKELVPPAALGWRGWASRLLLALVLGMLAGAGTALLLRLARPSWLAADAGALKEPAASLASRRAFAGRVAITLLAPAVLVVGSRIPLPGIDFTGLQQHPFRDPFADLSLLRLGLTPLLIAFLSVELLSLLTPGLRKLRGELSERHRLGQAVGIVALALALLEGRALASWLGTLEVLRGLWPTLLVASSLAGMTSVLFLVAGVINKRGLGNGYGALLLSQVSLSLAGAFPVDESALQELPKALWVFFFGGDAAAEYVLPEALAMIGVAALTACVLRWRTEADGLRADERLPLQAPCAGLAPLALLPALVAALAFASSLGLLDPHSPLQRNLRDLPGSPLVLLGVGAVTTRLWSWLFTRPALLSKAARRAGLAPPRLQDSLRSSAISLYLVIGISFLFGVAGPYFVIDGILVMIGAAAALDIWADARGRGSAQAPAAVLHQIQHVAAVEHRLSGAGIPHHVHGRHLRALLAFFGPFVPVVVLVPEERADQARTLLSTSPGGEAVVSPPETGEASPA